MANRIKTEKGEFNVGDKVLVETKAQPFTGVVIAIRGQGERKSFVVRKIAANKIGVERIWPVNSPVIKKISVKKKGFSRRAKL